MRAPLLESTPAQMSGPLSQATLIQTLCALFVGRLTGRLQFNRGDESLDLRFIAGHIVSGSSRSLSGRLGEIMTRSGVFSRTDLDLSLEQAVREGRRLGPVLVERGIATPAQIEEALRLQVRGVLFAAFFWRSGTLAFEPNDGAPSGLEEVSAGLSTSQLILQVVSSLDESTAVREALGDLDRRLAAIDDPRVRLEGVTLSPGDAFVLSRADGLLTAREILEITPLPRETVERSILSLLSVGVVEWRTRHHPRTAPQNHTVALSRDEVRQAIATEHAQQTSERLREIDLTFSGLLGKTHHDILGVAPRATLAEVRDAYQKLTRRFHPDAAGDVPAEQAAKVQAIFMRVSEAFNALRTSVPSPEAAAFAPPAPPSAEELLATAEEALAARPWETLAAVERVLAEATGPERRRARLLRARAHLKNPISWRDGELELREIQHENPTSADAALLLGAFYEDRGLTARAAAMFRKVLELKPGNRRAADELEGLPSSDPGPAAVSRVAAVRAS